MPTQSTRAPIMSRNARTTRRAKSATSASRPCIRKRRRASCACARGRNALRAARSPASARRAGPPDALGRRRPRRGTASGLCFPARHVAHAYASVARAMLRHRDLARRRRARIRAGAACSGRWRRLPRSQWFRRDSVAVPMSGRRHRRSDPRQGLVVLNCAGDMLFENGFGRSIRGVL